MSDIMKFIGIDPEDMEAKERMAELEEWDESIAREKASQEDLELTAEHLEVLQFLRVHYVKHGHTRHARDLTQALDAEFGAKGGRKYLYTLFPHGPVAQGGRLAGVPTPADSVDASFGSVQ